MLMGRTTTDVDVLQLKQLLISIKQYRPDICVRFRLIGELWQVSFMRVLDVTEEGVGLLDESRSKLIFIQNINNVMQFEIDAQFQNYLPHNHYDVKLIS